MLAQALANTWQDQTTSAFALQPQQFTFRRPQVNDATELCRLARACPGLDAYPVYAYLLLAAHFSDTCVVVTVDERVVGFVSAYIRPQTDNVLFVQQVVVDEQFRGHHLGQAMLCHVLTRWNLQKVRYLEAAVTPDNEVSRQLFIGLERLLGTSHGEQAWLAEELFADDIHDDEILMRLGPFRIR